MSTRRWTNPPTVAEYLDAWLSWKATRCSKATVRSDRRAARRLAERHGDLPLVAVTSADLAALLDDWLAGRLTEEAAHFWRHRHDIRSCWEPRGQFRRARRRSWLLRDVCGAAE